MKTVCFSSKLAAKFGIKYIWNTLMLVKIWLPGILNSNFTTMFWYSLMEFFDKIGNKLFWRCVFLKVYEYLVVGVSAACMLEGTRDSCKPCTLHTRLVDNCSCWYKKALLWRLFFCWERETEHLPSPLAVGKEFTGQDSQILGVRYWYFWFYITTLRKLKKVPSSLAKTQLRRKTARIIVSTISFIFQNG